MRHRFGYGNHLNPAMIDSVDGEAGANHLRRIYGFFTQTIYVVPRLWRQEAQLAFNYHDDPVLGPALAYWLRQRGASSMPRKRDIDPTEISPKILPKMQIIDVLDGGARFRYRLVGTALVEANGRDYTGQYPEELLSEDRASFVLNIYRTVCKLKPTVHDQPVSHH
jgi:hypothetical protein